jgi:hypothetical protein
MSEMPPIPLSFSSKPLPMILARGGSVRQRFDHAVRIVRWAKTSADFEPYREDVNAAIRAFNRLIKRKAKDGKRSVSHRFLGQYETVFPELVQKIARLEEDRNKSKST